MFKTTQNNQIIHYGINISIQHQRSWPIGLDFERLLLIINSHRVSISFQVTIHSLYAIDPTLINPFINNVKMSFTNTEYQRHEVRPTRLAGTGAEPGFLDTGVGATCITRITVFTISGGGGEPTYMYYLARITYFTISGGRLSKNVPPHRLIARLIDLVTVHWPVLSPGYIRAIGFSPERKCRVQSN
jgi:hypothetical protein